MCKQNGFPHDVVQKYVDKSEECLKSSTDSNRTVDRDKANVFFIN